MVKVAISVVALALMGGSAVASENETPQSLAELFAPIANGDCIAVKKARAATAFVQLTPEQFQFVRAFWMATPPLSRELPPGDKAFRAKDRDGDTVFGLYDDDQICSVIPAPDWLQHIIDEVGSGDVGKRGSDL